MAFIQSIFLQVFITLFQLLRWVFKLLQTPLIIYIVILVLAGILCIWLFRILKTQWRSGKSKSWVKLLLALGAEVIVTGFLLWYVFVHFHTFRFVS